MNHINQFKLIKNENDNNKIKNEAIKLILMR